MGKRQLPARHLGQTPYRDIPVRFQAACGLFVAPVESEALVVVVTRCMQHAHSMHGRLSLGPARTHKDAYTSDSDGGRHQRVRQVVLCTRAKRERRLGHREPHSATATKPTIKTAWEGFLAVPNGGKAAAFHHANFAVGRETSGVRQIIRGNGGADHDRDLPEFKRRG